MAQIKSGSTVGGATIFDTINHDYITYKSGNSNGQYVQAKDGTLICWHKYTSGALSTVTHSTMNMARGGTSWTFPKAFVGAHPTVIGSVGLGTSNLVAWLHVPSDSITTTKATMNIECAYAYNAMFVYVMAIGRWK